MKTIENENRTIFARQSVNGRATVADKVSISLKGGKKFTMGQTGFGRMESFIFLYI
jgi:hypothetical protein